MEIQSIQKTLLHFQTFSTSVHMKIEEYSHSIHNSRNKLFSPCVRLPVWGWFVGHTDVSIDLLLKGSERAGGECEEKVNSSPYKSPSRAQTKWPRQPNDPGSGCSTASILFFISSLTDSKKRGRDLSRRLFGKELILCWSLSRKFKSCAETALNPCE